MAELDSTIIDLSNQNEIIELDLITGDVIINEINDDIISATKLWSSQKINTEIESEAAMRENADNDLQNSINSLASIAHVHNNKNLLDTYNQTNDDIADAINKKHTHDNKAILDATQESFTTALKNSYDSHLVNINNPHNTTAAQVGLGNVTNDAQLKRAAGDFNSFTEKTTPADADITLIEDSANSYFKKKLTWDNIKTTLKTYFDTLYAKLAGLTAGYIPYKSASGELANSPIFTNGNYSGVGTNTPAAKWEVIGSIFVKGVIKPYGNVSQGYLVNSNTAGSWSDIEGAGDTLLRSDNNLILIARNNSNGNIIFGTQSPSTEKMRITTNGNVGIGTTSPTIGYKLDVIGDIRCQALTQYSDANKKENINNLDLGLDFLNKIRPVSFKWKNIEEIKEFEEVEEDVYEEQEVIVKEKIVELIDGKYVQKEIEKVVKQKMQIFDEYDLYDEQGNTIGKHQVPRRQKVMREVVKRQSENHKRTHFGLIAQEIEKVVQDMGIDLKDFGMLKITNYDNPDAEHVYGLDYTQLIPVLIKAIQELKAKVEQLE